MTPLEVKVLGNVRAGRLAVEGCGGGKTLARAQQAVLDLLERGWLELSPSDDAPPFVVSARGAAALESIAGSR